MSAALRIVERLAVVDDVDERVVVFSAVLLAPLYGRVVGLRPDGSGNPLPVSRPRA